MGTINDNNPLITINNEQKNLQLAIDLYKSVKSFYIIDYIFSFLDEKKKLGMIIYSNKFQKKFGINLDYYKKISGKIHLGERNGYGKELKLDSNILIFEGEYLGGKKNGKGKEYYENGKIKFEGEYLNGKRNGMEKAIIKIPILNILLKMELDW